MKKIIYLILMIILSACNQTPTGITVNPTKTNESLTKEQTQVINSPSPEPTATLDTFLAQQYANIEEILFKSPHNPDLSCTSCHIYSNGIIQEELIKLNNTDSGSILLSKTSELCTNCHPDQNHIEKSADAAFAHQEFECTNCHDPHILKSDCTQSGCHLEIRRIMNASVEPPQYHPKSGDENSYMCGGSACHNLAKEVAESPIYHQPTHNMVPCYVCHDASDSEVSQDENKSWGLLRKNGEQNNQEERIVSHKIIRQAECSNCHYINNNWNLIEIISGN